MNDPHDDALRKVLQAARHDSEHRAPDFAQTWRAAKAMRPTPAPSWRLAWAGAAAAGIVLCAVFAPSRKPAPVAAVAPAATDDALPTDFLLTTNTTDPVDQVAGEIDALLQP